MTSKGMSLAKVIKGRTLSEREYQIIGRLEEEPKLGKNLVYVANGQTHNTQEVIAKVTKKEKHHPFYPGRIIIETDKNMYIADDFVAFSENSRRGSRL